jgi:hypothetical protein
MPAPICSHRLSHQSRIAGDHSRSAAKGVCAIHLVESRRDRLLPRTISYAAGSGSYIDYGLTALGAPGIDLFELLMNASYDFRFRGENGSGNSAWTDVLNQTTGTPNNTLTAPSACAVSNITESTADVTWTETEKNETTVLVYYNKDGDSALRVIQAGTHERFVTLSGLSR